MTSGPEEQAAGLQKTIQQAGRATLQLRRCVMIGLMVLAAAGLIWGIVDLVGLHHWLISEGYPYAVRKDWTEPPLHGFVPWLVVMTSLRVVCWGLFAFVVALLASGMYRSRRRAQLRRMLSVLPPGQVAEVLLPLREGGTGDTRKIAESLMRDFQVPAELTPTPHAEGRGDEASPAGETDDGRPPS